MKPLAPGQRPVVRPFGRLSIVYDRRAILAVTVLLLATVGVGLVTMLTGQYRLDVAGVWRALFGGSDPVSEMVVVGLRLPRLLTAALVGAGLGVAGAIFQSVARNPLASPDIVGFTTGSATGALVIILVLGETTIGVGMGALIGGFATAVLVYVIALERGTVGAKLILVGIAIAAMLAAVNDFLLTRADLERAQAAKTWLFGSLHATNWPTASAVAACCGILLPLAILLSSRLRVLELGDDRAASLGLRLGRTKVALLGTAVALTAVAIAGAGPIGFVALAAPQLARRVARTVGIGVASSAAMGALLVVAADLAAQRLLAPFQIPVGLITGALGGGYLVYLLAQEWRRTGR